MSDVGCPVRSTSKRRSPGPLKSVARPLRVSVQPGGTSMLNPAAALLAAVAVTVCVDQSAAGSAVDGLLSASIDLKPLGVSATEGTALGLPVLPALAALVLPFLFSARAVPTPIAAATITATTSQRIRRPAPRPRPARPPRVPGVYCPRSG